MVSTLAEDAFQAFLHLLNEEGVSPFPHAILKLPGQSKLLTLQNSITVPQSPKLNLWKLITLYTLKISRDHVFLCFIQLHCLTASFNTA